MEIARELKDTENALREFIAAVMLRNLGENWIDDCGLPQTNTEVWRKRKAEAEAQVQPMHGEEAVIFYAPFEDLITIIKHHWELE